LFNVLPLTIVVDYLQDNVSVKINKFLSIHKIINKVIKKNLSQAEDVALINLKLQKL